jgi:HipA-like protein
MSEELYVFCGEKVMMSVIRDPRRNKLLFRYEQAWQSDPGSFPLSLSMPLTAREHPHDAIESFLWGLLPDNDGVLRRWGTKFQVSSKNAFALLSHVGEDCAGGIQFVRSEKIDRAPRWTNAWPCSSETMRPRDPVPTRDNSVWLEPSRKSPCSATKRGGDGVFPPATCPPRTS